MRVGFAPTGNDPRRRAQYVPVAASLEAADSRERMTTNSDSVGDEAVGGKTARAYSSYAVIGAEPTTGGRGDVTLLTGWLATAQPVSNTMARVRPKRWVATKVEEAKVIDEWA